MFGRRSARRRRTLAIFAATCFAELGPRALARRVVCGYACASASESYWPTACVLACVCVCVPASVGECEYVRFPFVCFGCRFLTVTPPLVWVSVYIRRFVARVQRFSPFRHYVREAFDYSVAEFVACSCLAPAQKHWHVVDLIDVEELTRRPTYFLHTHGW